MELISVIMPTHNSARWIPYTIDNLAAQTYPHFELIVVDDGSQDDTVRVLRDKLAGFKKPWQLIELPENRGPSAARNHALKAARGAWVQYLDSDDFIAPVKFELQIAHCARAAADLAAVCSPWSLCHIDEGHVTLLREVAQPNIVGRAPIVCLLGPEVMLLGAGLARRSVLEQIGGSNETLRFWECEELNFRIAQTGRLEHVPSASPLYFWRMHRGRSYIGDAAARYRATSVGLSWLELVLQGLDHKTLEETGLSARDRRDILGAVTYWARELFAADRAVFRRFLAKARQLDPNLAPAHPALIANIAKHIGYERAEAVAHAARAPKALLRRIRDNLRDLIAPERLGHPSVERPEPKPPGQTRPASKLNPG